MYARHFLIYTYYSLLELFLITQHRSKSSSPDLQTLEESSAPWMRRHPFLLDVLPMQSVSAFKTRSFGKTVASVESITSMTNERLSALCMDLPVPLNVRVPTRLCMLM